MVGIESANDFPVFIPPRKRSQLTKKPKENQNYVDHIVTVNLILSHFMYKIMFSYVFIEKNI